MVVAPDNPVGRLYGILFRARQYGANESALEVWSKVLAFDPADEAAMLHRFLALRSLIDEAYYLVGGGTEESRRDRYLQPFQQLKAVVTVRLMQRPWEETKSVLTEALMVRLELYSDQFSRLENIEGADEELKAIVEALHQLRESILTTDLPDEVRAFFTFQIHALERAIDEYRIRGPQALRRIVSDFIGAVVVNGKHVTETGGGQMLEGLLAIAVRVDKVASAVLKAKKLIEFGASSGLLGVMLPPPTGS